MDGSDELSPSYVQQGIISSCCDSPEPINVSIKSTTLMRLHELDSGLIGSSDRIDQGISALSTDLDLFCGFTNIVNTIVLGCAPANWMVGRQPVREDLA